MFQYANAKAHYGLCVKNNIMWKNKIVMHMVPSCDYDMRGGLCASRGAAAGCTGLVELFYAAHIAMHWFSSKHPKKGHFENHW